MENCLHDCYCKQSTQPVDLELLQRYVRLRENGKYLNLEINCSDGTTRSVHKYILNSLSVNLGRSILACKYFCLVPLQVPKCFEQVQIFCARVTAARTNIYLHSIVAFTKIVCQTKIGFALKRFMSLQKTDTNLFNLHSVQNCFMCRDKSF